MIKYGVVPLFFFVLGVIVALLLVAGVLCFVFLLVDVVAVILLDGVL